jgi:PilZ domain-containing protein
LKADCVWCGAGTEFDDGGELSTKSHNTICSRCLLALFPKNLCLAENTDENKNVSAGRRKLARCPVVSRVFFSTESQKNQITEILLIDISDQGMKIQINKRLCPGEKIAIGFSSYPIVYKALGLVRHVKDLDQEGRPCFQAGIQLTGIHQDLTGEGVR